jgi:hypothetical protein
MWKRVSNVERPFDPAKPGRASALFVCLPSERRRPQPRALRQQSATDCFRKVIDFDDTFEEVFVKLVDKRDRTAR